MVVLKGNNVFMKLLYFLRTYILTIKRFDLFLQGALLVVVLLECNCYLLLRRDSGTGRLPAMNEEWLFMGSGVAEFVCGAFLGWFNKGRKQFALSGWLLLTAGSGLLVLAFPYAESNPPSVELCGGQPITSYTSPESPDPNATGRLTMLIVTAVLCSLTRISVWSHGLTYMDDHDPTDGAYYYGILISIRLSLGLSGENWLRAGSVREDWWVAHISICMLVFMFSVLFTFFKTKMAQFKEVEVTDDTSFFPSVKRILSNKAVMLQTLGMALINTAVFCFINYDAAYVEARFLVESRWTDRRTSRVGTDIFRALVVIFFVMIFRMRFSVRRSEGVKANTSARVGGVVSLFVAAFFVVLAILPCSRSDIVGLEDGIFTGPSCSEPCGCSSERTGFTPVCAPATQETFFSPCYAGCTDYEDLNGILLFENCTCAYQRAVRGSCNLPNCGFAFDLYVIIYTVILGVGGAAIMMQGMVLLRAVPRWDKPVSIGLCFGIIALLSQGGGRALYLLISNLTCAYENEIGGVCVFHNANLWWMAVASAVFCVASAVVSFVASAVARSQLNKVKIAIP